MRTDRELKAWEVFEREIYPRVEADFQIFRKNYPFNPSNYDWGQARYRWITNAEDFIAYNVDRLKKGFNPKGSKGVLPIKYRHIVTTDVYWKILREATLAYYDNRCYICGCEAEEVHHVLPRAYGGTDNPENVVPLCQLCHKEVHRRLESLMRFAISSSIEGLMKP